jgi:hypothetical protein
MISVTLTPLSRKSLIARPEKQVPFDYAQGRLSTPLKYASLLINKAG